MRKLTETDKLFRKNIVECDGRLADLAEIYGITVSSMSGRLKAEKHFVWWLAFKEAKKKRIAVERRKRANKAAKERSDRRWAILDQKDRGKTPLPTYRDRGKTGTKSDL